MYTSTRSSRPEVGPIGMSWLAPTSRAPLAGQTFAWIIRETHADSGIDGFTGDGHTTAVDSIGRARLDR